MPKFIPLDVVDGEVIPLQLEQLLILTWGRMSALYQLSSECLYSWESARIVKWLRHWTSNPVSRDRSSQGSKIHTADGGQQVRNSCPVFSDFSSVHRFIWRSMNYPFKITQILQTDHSSGTNEEPQMPKFIPSDVVAGGYPSAARTIADLDMEENVCSISAVN